MSFISHNNYTNICRTCLIENSNMKSIFCIEDVIDQKIMLCDMLMSCASIMIMQGDGLPEYICINCFQEVNTAYLFRKLCEKSDTTLRACSTLNNLASDENIFSDIIHENKLSSDTQDKDLHLRKNCVNQIFLEEQSMPEEAEVDAAEQLGSPDLGTDENSSEDECENKTNSSMSNKKNYKCKKCDKSCLGLTVLRTHMAEVHGDVFHCDQCGKQFTAKNLLARHITCSHKNIDKPKQLRNKTGIIKKRNLPRTCDICNKTFRFHSNLERHKLTHTGEKPFLCNVCGKGFAQMAYLKIHSFTHTGEKPYKCQMCERSFAAPGTLMTHIRTHTGERPHICKICGKDFPQSGYLSSHIRTHTGEKPIECKVCHRRFNQSGRLVVHMRIHSGEKPYQCKECGKSFAIKGTLKKHTRIHTGERPYICKVCGQTFAQSGTLSTHMKVHNSKQGMTG